MKHIDSFKNFLNEDADKVFYKGYMYHWASDAYCFGYYDNKFHIADNVIHSDLIKVDDDDFLNYTLKLAKKNNIDLKSDEYLYYEPPELERYDFEYPGRLWKGLKIISFWSYPKTKQVLKKIAKDIKKQTGINILSDGWQIETLNDVFIDIHDFHKETETKVTNKNIQHHIPPLKRKKGYYKKGNDSYLYKRLENKYKK